VRLLGAWDGTKLLGGILTVTTPTVAHAQYIAGSDEGLARGVVDGCSTS